MNADTSETLPPGKSARAVTQRKPRASGARARPRVSQGVVPPAAASSDMSSAVASIRDAFGVFEMQSAVLRQSYESLKHDLAVANRQLSEKNQALSSKVAELGEVSGRLECVLESLTDGVLVVDRNLRVERCNAAAAALIGRDRSSLEGRPYEEVTNGLGNAAVIRDAIEHGRSIMGQSRSHTDGDGYTVEVLAGVAPIRTPDGSVPGAVEVLQDVTALRRLESRAKSRERMAALGEMAASVAHEIRNPLGTIEGFARLLKRDSEGQPSAYRLASRIVEGAQNLNYVITNLLTYARPMTLTREPFSVERLLIETREVLGDKALRAKAELKMQVDGPDFQAYGDVRQLRQVLLNLGLNAVEACAEGGQVEIEARRSGRTVRFVVQDNGCGIAVADQEKIFDPFFTNKQGGTGLGLSLCHKIVEMHSGTINVESKIGAGSRFEVIIPDAKDGIRAA